MKRLLLITALLVCPAQGYAQQCEPLLQKCEQDYDAVELELFDCEGEFIVLFDYANFIIDEYNLCADDYNQQLKVIKRLKKKIKALKRRLRR